MWCIECDAANVDALVDVRLSEKRDMEVAQAFFRSAQAVSGVAPASVTTDCHNSFSRAIRTELTEGETPDQAISEQSNRTGPSREQGKVRTDEWFQKL
jgi:transposase-like protein